MTQITIPWEVYDEIEARAAGPTPVISVLPEGVTIQIHEQTVERLAKHFPGVAPAEAIGRLFRGRAG